MAYSAPIFQGGDHTDAVAQYTAQGLSSMGQGLADGLAGLFGNIEKSKQARLEDKTAGKLWDAFAKINPEVEQFSDMFYGADKGTKKSILGGLMEMFQGRDQAAAAADQRVLAREKFEWDKNPQSRMPLPFKTPGGHSALVTAGGAVVPESDLAAPESDGGEWRPLPTNPRILGHWTKSRGFTGAQAPAEAAATLPALTFVEDPATGRGAYIGPDGDLVDPAKLVETEPVPGTARPGYKGPLPFLPGVGGMSVNIPAAPEQRRPVAKPEPPKTVKPQVTTTPNGTLRTWPDGREEFLQWTEGGAPQWVPMAGPSSPLFPDGMLPPGGYADPAVPPPAALQPGTAQSALQSYIRKLGIK